MKQEKPVVKKNKQIIIDWLVEHFPNAFFKKAKQVKPLQIGIFDEIIAFCAHLDSLPFNQKALKDALNYYSSSPAYLGAQKINSARIDLYGNEVDVVTEEQAKYAYIRYQHYMMKKNKDLSGKT